MGSAQQTPKCPQWIAAGRGGLYRPAQSSSLPTPSPPSAADRLKQPLEVVCVAVCGELTTAQQALLQLLLRKLDTDESELAWIDQQMELLFAPYTRQMELLDSIPGIDTLAAATILAEIGPQPQAHFATPAHLASWAGLVPRNDESAGKVKSRSILPGNPYLKVILCQVAWIAVRRRGSTDRGTVLLSQTEGQIFCFSVSTGIVRSEPLSARSSGPTAELSTVLRTGAVLLSGTKGRTFFLAQRIVRRNSADILR